MLLPSKLYIMNRQQIIEAIAELPVKERMALIRDLQSAAATDADSFSAGKADDNAAYLQIVEADKAKEQETKQTAEQTYAATAAKAITPQTVNKETAGDSKAVPTSNDGSSSDEKKPGDNLKEANKEQGLPANAAPGANAQHS